MLFVPKWKSSVWHLPSNLFHSHRLHNASNFYSKLILNWISAWRSCSSGSLETEQDSLEPDWQHFSPFPLECIWALQIQSSKPSLDACSTEALQLILCRQSRNTWFVSSSGIITAALHHTIRWIPALTHCSLILYPMLWALLLWLGMSSWCLFQQGSQVSKRYTAAPTADGYSCISWA